MTNNVLSSASQVMGEIQIYDCTLRDGTQGEGFNLSLEDKLEIAKALDAFWRRRPNAERWRAGGP